MKKARLLGAAAEKAAAGTALRKPTGRRLAGFSREEHGGPVRPFRFVQMADTQVGMESVFLKSKPKTWDAELALVRRAAEEVNRLRPAFAVVCGDLVDEFPPEVTDPLAKIAKDADVRDRQEKDLKDAFNLVDPEIPLLCLCGNHDIGNRPNSATIKRYVDGFGDDYFSFWCHGVKCLVVNSQLWEDDTEAKEQREAMDKWLDEELAELSTEQRNVDGSKASRKTCPVLVFSHIAPFIFDPDEKDEYFNLRPNIRRPLLEKFAQHGAVAWFCGHYHRNAGGVYHHESGQKLEVIITGAVGTQITDKKGGEPLGLSGMGGHLIGEDVSGFRIVNVLADGSVEHKWRTFTELRQEAEGKHGSEAE